MGNWSYSYDANGNLISQTDAKEQTIAFTYDALNRITLKDCPTGVDVSYAYDDPDIPQSKGRLTSVTDASGSSTYHYDNLGRKIKTIKEIDSTEYVTEKSYDLLNRIITYKYPDGEIVTYTYNKSGGIETVIGDTTYVSDVDYDASNQITHIQYGNGNYTNYAYNLETRRLEGISTSGGTGETLQDLSYQFDSGGNILEIVDSVNTATQSFEYDDLNRLTQAEGSYGTNTYAYDSIGNILEKNGITYSYGQEAGPHAVTGSDDGLTTSYDANGNMLSRNEDTYEYDYENRLTCAVSTGGATEETQIVINLEPGWNFISMPLIPESWNIEDVLCSITLGTDYLQVSRYNPQEDSFEQYVGNPKFNQFDTLEYGRGYQIYVNNPNGCSLTLAGMRPDVSKSYNLSTGWNLVSSPVYEETPIEEALSFLDFGIDYDMLVRYNNASDTYETYPGSLTTLTPAEAYYIYCLKQVNYAPPLKMSTTTFVYNAQGNRVKKSTADETTFYIGKSYEVTNGLPKKYIFIGNNRIASRDEDGDTYFYHSDHIHGSNVITDFQGSSVQLLEYTPFGQTSLNSGTINVAHKFTGQELDAPTGLYYYGARYYNPALGKFITPDSLIQAPYDPQSLNRYAYARNNPVKYIDPTGHFFESIRSFFSSIFNFSRRIFSWFRPSINTFTPYTSLRNLYSVGNQVYSRQSEPQWAQGGGYGGYYGSMAAWQDVPRSTNKYIFGAKITGQIKYNALGSFDINKYNQEQWDVYYGLCRGGNYQKAEALYDQIKEDQAMGNWAVKWIPGSNATFTKERLPTEGGSLKSNYVLKFGSPRPVLEVQAIIHVQQYGHHRFFGLIDRSTFQAHWGLKTDETTYMYGVNLGELGVLYYPEEEP